jgi:hypothetical protein
VVVAYSPELSVLYVNGQAIAAGAGIPVYPPPAARALHGFSVGSNRNGAEQAKGEFEELETFDYALSSEEVSLQYEAMQEPGGFSVSFDPDHIQTTTATGLIELDGQVTASMAILVNSQEFETAVWVPFTPTPTVTLGSADGVYTVWVALKGLRADAESHWEGVEVAVDRVSPTVTGISPPNGISLSQPVLQLKLEASEELESASYDLSNAAGVVLNQTGFILDKFFDTNLFRYTTSWVQCYDVPLEEGSNAVSVRLRDLAGNMTTTNLTYYLGYGGDTTPPAVTVLWPPAGAPLSGTDFALHGTIDDPTAAVAVTVTANGVPTTVNALVGRDGAFWAAGLPLGTGETLCTVTATDAAGNQATVNRAVQQALVSLSIDPIDLGGRTTPVTITGTVGNPALHVSVNGVAAVVDSSGCWTALNVTPQDTGLAFFEVEATQPGQPAVPLANRGKLHDLEPEIALAEYNLSYTLTRRKLDGGHVPGDNPTREDVTFIWHATNTVDTTASHGVDIRVAQFDPGAYPPPDTVVRTVEVWTWWPYVAEGELLKQYYTIASGQQPAVTITEPLWFRPPQCGIPLPWERCLRLKRQKMKCGPFELTWTRNAFAKTLLFAGRRQIGKQKAFVVVDVPSPVDYTKPYRKADILAGPYREPSSLPDSDLSESVPIDEFSAFGLKPNADSRVPVLLPEGGYLAADPTMKGKRKWSTYGFTPKRPRLITMTRAWHEDFGDKPPELQAGFDQGSVLLGRDDDKRLATDPGMPARLFDDVPAYYEFHIVNAAQCKFADPSPEADWFDIRAQDELDDLVDEAGSDIKQVHSIYIQDRWVGGCAIPCPPPRIVLAGQRPSMSMIHEWIHTADVQHRGQKVHDEIPNPGVDDKAFMYSKEDKYANEINRNELGRIRDAYPDSP